MIGSSFPSTYVDPAGLIPYGGNLSYGSFTGGVALTTGTFAPGVVPNWTTSGANSTGASLFTGPSPAPVTDANTLLTVRYIVPEPATGLLGFGAAAVMSVIWRRRRW